jgi:hypothetical protein
MDIVLVGAFLRADWHAISASIRKREGLANTTIEEGDIEARVTHEMPLKYGSTTERSIPVTVRMQ